MRAIFDHAYTAREVLRLRPRVYAHFIEPEASTWQRVRLFRQMRSSLRQPLPAWPTGHF